MTIREDKLVVLAGDAIRALRKIGTGEATDKCPEHNAYYGLMDYAKEQQIKLERRFDKLRGGKNGKAFK